MLLDRELALEEESRTLGIDSYNKRRADSKEGDLPPGIQLIRRALLPMAQDLQAWIEHTGPGTKSHLIPWFRENRLGYEEMCFLALRTTLNMMSLQGVRLQTVANRISSHLQDSIEYRKFKEQAEGMLRAVENKMNKSQTKRRQRILWDAKRRAGIPDDKLPSDMKFKIGHKLLDILVESTGLFQLLAERSGTKSHKVHVVPTCKLLDWLKEGHEICQELTPFLQPMVVEPLDWTDLSDGGYYTFNQPFVKRVDPGWLKEYDKQDYEETFRAVNAVQSTAWRINRPVLDILHELVESQSQLGGLPPTGVELDLPSEPWGPPDNREYWRSRHPEAFKKYKKECWEIYTEFYRNTSNRVSLFYKLSMADKFAEDVFWFPYNVDFRGRLYPLVNFLTPQGDDTAKALLVFAEGRPLTDRGLFWLKVHLANTWGFDKASFSERKAWTDSQHQAIVRSADCPLDERWWADADKPFCFLAACKEYAAWIRGELSATHLPVQMDGTCNGLQHLSAMLRDERGAKSVNLLPGDKPRDIYTEVADETRAQLEADLRKPEVEHYARFWLPKLDRKLTKRNTMTLPYGVSRYGMIQQLIDEVQFAETDGQRWFEGLDAYQYCAYLGKINWRSTAKVIKAARVLMDWFKEVAACTVEADKDVSWTAPSGFKIRPQYRKLDSRRIYTFSGMVRVAYSIAERGRRRDTAKIRQSLSPNVIHSFDAAHLVLTVNQLKAQGLHSYSLIHDSYGVHAPDVDQLRMVLRSTFVDMYTPDVLRNFKKEVEDEIGREVPEVPAFGDLAVSEILASPYFFS